MQTKLFDLHFRGVTVFVAIKPQIGIITANAISDQADYKLTAMTLHGQVEPPTKDSRQHFILNLR